MEYLQRIMNIEDQNIQPLYQNELEQASNSYLMAIVAVIVGLPLPIINVLASLGYYFAHKNSVYFVRWHSLQALLAQCVIIPFNSIAFAWTVSLLVNDIPIKLFSLQGESASVNGGLPGISILHYLIYLLFIILLNVAEFIATIYTASQVRKGVNVRWFLIANITDNLCSKQKTDPYRI